MGVALQEVQQQMQRQARRQGQQPAGVDPTVPGIRTITATVAAMAMATAATAAALGDPMVLVALLAADAHLAGRVEA